MLAGAISGLVLAAGPAAAQYPPSPYYDRPVPTYQPRYYPQQPPAYYPAPDPYYTPAPRRSGGVANQCATDYGTCQIGPTRPGRYCNCFFPGSGKIPGVAVR